MQLHSPARRTMYPRAVHRTSVVALVCCVVACGGDPSRNPTAPDDSNESASRGRIVVSASTMGEFSDPAGYTVLVDGVSRGSIGPNGQFVVQGLIAGQHVISLSEPPANCVVAGSHPRSVLTSIGSIDHVAFSVVCAKVLTWIRVSTNTIPRGYVTPYTVVLDGHAAGPIDPTGAFVLAGVAPGTHSIRLDVPRRCSMQFGFDFFLGYSQTVNLGLGGNRTVAFSVRCT